LCVFSVVFGSDQRLSFFMLSLSQVLLSNNSEIELVYLYIVFFLDFELVKFKATPYLLDIHILIYWEM